MSLNEIELPVGIYYNSKVIVDGKPYVISLKDDVEFEFVGMDAAKNVEIHSIDDDNNGDADIYCLIRMTRAMPELRKLWAHAQYITPADLDFLLTNSPHLDELTIGIQITEPGNYVIPAAPITDGYLRIYVTARCTLDLTNYDGYDIYIKPETYNNRIDRMMVRYVKAGHLKRCDGDYVVAEINELEEVNYCRGSSIITGSFGDEPKFGQLNYSRVYPTLAAYEAASGPIVRSV